MASERRVYDHWDANLTVMAMTLVAIAGCVLVHYAGLEWLSRALPKMRVHRRTLLVAIFAVLGLHLVEVWIFGLGYWVLLAWPATGQITGIGDAVLLDCVYFSSSVYSTVGFGDLAPLGPVRFMAGTEGIAGLALIGWSASFTYLEMERRWRPGK